MTGRGPWPGWLWIAARVGIVVAVGVLALWVRLGTIDRLPIDFDEDDYLRAGQLYAEGFQAGDPSVLLRENYRPEHPPLTKILTGLALTPLEPAPLVPDRPTDAAPAESLPEPHFQVARGLQAAFGAAAALLLALVSPLAGIVLGVHTWTVKYSSQVMLEAVPALLSLVAVLAAGRAMRSDRPIPWWVLSAAGFGLACAAKYMYGVAGLAIIAVWLWSSRPQHWRDGRGLLRWVAPKAGWLAVGFGFFLLGDPYLWPDPVGRLGDSLAFHLGYAGSEAVTRTGWPAWQPLAWLFGSVPFHPPGTFVVALDLFVTVFALLGLGRLWRDHRLMAVWLGLALAFLVVWPTKWPQYLLLLSIPLSLAAALGLRAMILEPTGRWIGRVRARRSGGARGRGLGQLREATPWLLPGVAGLAVLVLIPILYELAMSTTDFSSTSLRDGLNGGVMREVVGGLTGAIEPGTWSPDASSTEVRYVAGDLLAGITRGYWLGDQTTAAFPAFSFLWAGLSVLLASIVGVGIALLLARPGVRFANAWRVLFILPWAIPEFVGAVAWRMILHPERGYLALAVGQPVPWTASPEISLVVLLLISTWMGFPLMMLVATAGLQAVPRSAVEAAAIDGAGSWTRTRAVILPLLLPLLVPAMVIRGIAAFNQFYLFFALIDQLPGGMLTMATFSYFLFDYSSGPGWFAVSAAINVLTIVALGILVAWFLAWRERAERVAYA